MSRLMTKPTKWLCAQQRLRSAWASAQSDQSHRCALNGYLRTQAFFMRTAETLIRLGGSPGSSESSLGTHAILTVGNVAYRKTPKYSDTQKICCNHSKIWTMWLHHRVMSPNNADGMANSVDPDQTAPLGVVWSGSALFAQAYLSENLGSLRYFVSIQVVRLKQIY